MPSDDPFSLERFITAQVDAYQRARDELRAGVKRSHWMWFVFPQAKGLGGSATSQFYGIGSIAEARAYLKHPVLGPRLIEATNLVLALRGRTLRDIFGTPDDLKFCSSMTLFSRAAGPGSAFDEALSVFCGGEADRRTLALLSES